MSTVRSDFFNILVNQTYEDIFFEKSNYYFFLGKINPWGDEDEPEFDAFPRTSEYDRRIRDNILYLDRIRPTNASIVTRRIDWESGKVFDFWDHTLNMEKKPFYCVTSDFGVYKCLYNGGGVPSLVEPGIRSTQPFRTSDGYLWKYMYTIAPVKATKFLYDKSMPVQKALTDTFYNNGAIEEVNIVSGGSGYTTNQLTTIDISDTTTGFGAEGKIVSVGVNGEITDVSIIPDSVDLNDLDSDSELIQSDGIIESTGQNYFAGTRVNILSETGIGAVIEPIIIEGRITGFDIVDPGAGYNSTDELSIVVGGGEIIPVVSQDNGSIIDLVISDPGIGYSDDPILTVLPINSGSGIYGNTSAVLKAQVFEGSIVNATIEDPGVNYPIDNETTITVSGDGSGASFVPIVDPDTGEIIKVIVDSPGSGYTYAVLGVDGSGSGANIESLIEGSDISGYQSIIEQTSVEGAIYAIKLTNQGTGYSDDTVITIEGDGEGAVAEPIIERGVIKEIIMTKYGNGYSYANVTINDPGRIPDANTDIISAEAYAILPPINGHGFDAVTELFGRTLAIYSVVRYDTLLDLIDQDYRQYGIIQNPRTLSGNRKLVERSLLTDFELSFSNTDGIKVDEILINNNVQYRVISVNGTLVKLQQLSSSYKIPSLVFSRKDDPSQTYNLTNVLSTPIVNKYSGNLLYTTNRGLFEPSDDLSFTVRSFLEFKTDS